MNKIIYIYIVESVAKSMAKSNKFHTILFPSLGSYVQVIIRNQGVLSNEKLKMSDKA